MMQRWRTWLSYDPIPSLLGAQDEALSYFVRRDLLDDDVGPVERLWQLREAQKLLRVQLSSGAWTDPWRRRSTRRSTTG